MLYLRPLCFIADSIECTGRKELLTARVLECTRRALVIQSRRWRDRDLSLSSSCHEQENPALYDSNLHS